MSFSTVTPICLIEAAFVPSAQTTEYTAPASSTVIIDKFTVTNTDVGAQTVSINLVPSAGTAATSNLVIDAFSISAGATKDFTELQNQILSAGDFISLIGSIASKLVMRASGRLCQ